MMMVVYVTYVVVCAYFDHVASQMCGWRTDVHGATVVSTAIVLNKNERDEVDVPPVLSSIDEGITKREILLAPAPFLRAVQCEPSQNFLESSFAASSGQENSADFQRQPRIDLGQCICLGTSQYGPQNSQRMWEVTEGPSVSDSQILADRDDDDAKHDSMEIQGTKKKKKETWKVTILEKNIFSRGS
mmetsp:Transcript_33314/g.76904  ORF Transcript_33314/g.76904 Transcript_33314/m.76904 type:complete len:187 (-) Transcript_33314:1147-1707(-)